MYDPQLYKSEVYLLFDCFLICIWDYYLLLSLSIPLVLMIRYFVQRYLFSKFVLLPYRHFRVCSFLNKILVFNNNYSMMRTFLLKFYFHKILYFVFFFDIAPLTKKYISHLSLVIKLMHYSKTAQARTVVHNIMNHWARRIIITPFIRRACTW